MPPFPGGTTQQKADFIGPLLELWKVQGFILSGIHKYFAYIFSLIIPTTSNNTVHGLTEYLMWYFYVVWLLISVLISLQMK